MARANILRGAVRIFLCFSILAVLTVAVSAPALAQPERPAAHASAAIPYALQRAHADLKHLPVGTMTLTYDQDTNILRSNVTLQGLQPNSTVIVETVQITATTRGA